MTSAVIDGRAAARPELGGVERWARALPRTACAAIGRVRRLPRRPPSSHRAGHAWERSRCRSSARRADARLLCPANLAPVASRSAVLILHDAASLRHPGCLRLEILSTITTNPSVGGLSARGAFCSGSSIERTGFFIGALIVSQKRTGGS